MEVGNRFSSPVLETKDLEKFNKQFSDNAEKVEETLKNAPYEISILACLIERIEERLDGNKNEL